MSSKKNKKSGQPKATFKKLTLKQLKEVRGGGPGNPTDNGIHYSSIQSVVKKGR